MDSTSSDPFKDVSPQSSDERASTSANETSEIKTQPMLPETMWQSLQNKFAEEAGLAVLLIDGKQPPSLAVSNNNSICRTLQSSRVYAHLCEPYCGKAFDNVQNAEKAVSYRCHAGLQCVAVPLPSNVIRPLALIVGRAFTKVSEYQNFLDRISNGEWQGLPTSELCRNLLFAENKMEIADAAGAFQVFDQVKMQTLIEFVARTEPNPFSQTANSNRNSTANVNTFEVNVAKVSNQPDELKSDNQQSSAVLNPANLGESIKTANLNNSGTIHTPDTIEDFTAWQLFTDALLDKSFEDACAKTLHFLAVRYDLAALGWLERSTNNLLKPFLAHESLLQPFQQLELVANDSRLQAAVLAETSYRPQNVGDIELFPLAVGEDVRAAIVVADSIENDDLRFRIARFCHQIAVSLEVLRLREELARRAEIIRMVQLFNEKLNHTNHNSLFDSLIETCAEFLNATRSSLLIFNETERKLKVVAAIGHCAEKLKQNQFTIGERVAEQVFRRGKPILIENVSSFSLPPAPIERGYRSQSFISFPLVTGSRPIGVLNVTDKHGGGSYSQNDLDLLEAIAPQLTIALDRAAYQQRAGMFEQLSITDSLTGLLNRRYLNERLSEEVSRSRRDNSPMSFIMIDIDNFKSYNDAFGHQAGDEILRQTAQCLKTVLRSADVAARYGGEEFSLLLPQTTLSEARMIAERIRERIENTVFPHRKITVSVGVAAYSPFHNTTDEIIEAADKALYEAKRAGKNNVQTKLFGQNPR